MKEEEEEEEEAHSRVSWSKCISVARVRGGGGDVDGGGGGGGAVEDARATKQDSHQSVERDFPVSWEDFTQPQPQPQNLGDTSASVAGMNGPQPLHRELLTMQPSLSSQFGVHLQEPSGHHFHGVHDDTFNRSSTAQDGDEEGNAQRWRGRPVHSSVVRSFIRLDSTRLDSTRLDSTLKGA